MGRSDVRMSSTVHVRVCVCVPLGVVRCNNNLLHLQRVGRRGQTKKKEIKNIKELHFALTALL